MSATLPRSSPRRRGPKPRFRSNQPQHGSPPEFILEPAIRPDPGAGMSGDQTSRPHARTSSTNSSGSSIAAKWPPRGMSRQRLML